MKRMKRTISVVGSAFLLATALVITAPVGASADQIGLLDRTFGVGGMVSTAFLSNVPGMGGYLEDSANAVAVQPDGKIVAAGSAGCRLDFGDPGCSFAVARYDADGSLDATFSGDGKVKTRFSAGAQAYDVALQPDGKIVVAGEAWRDPTDSDDWDLALARYETDGSLDTTFGTNGLARAFVGSGVGARALVIQPDGYIVAGGPTGIARFDTHGTLDPSFGTGGIRRMDGNVDLAVQSDSKIVVVRSTAHAFVATRLNTNGTLDKTFGVDGHATANFGPGGVDVSRVAVQPDGAIVVAGSHRLNYVYSVALARFTTYGSVDTSFGIDGMVTTQVADGETYDQSVGRGLAIQPNGAIVVVGGVWSTWDPSLGPQDNAFESAFGIVRYTERGSLDRRFSGDGKLLVYFGQNWDFQQATSVALGPSGAIVVAGESPMHHGDFGIVRIVVPKFRPDAIVGEASWWPDYAWGDDIYETTGRDQVTMDSGLPGPVIRIAVQNDGSATDTFTVHGCGSTGPFVVRYSHQGVDVTRRVVAGDYRLGPVAPGDMRFLRLRITKLPASPAKAGEIRCRVLVRSDGNGTRVDAIRAIWDIEVVGCLTQKNGTGHLLGCDLR